MSAPDNLARRARIGAAFAAARDYDRHARVQHQVAQDLAARIAALPLPPQARVLELGCGTGFLTAELARREIGGAGVLAAAALWAVNPMALWFHRDFIHETLFVAALTALLLCGWRALHDRAWRWSLCAGFAAGLAISCKETFIIHAAVLGLAALAGGAWPAFRQGPPRAALARIAGAGAVTLAVVIAAYTWMGRHPSGPIDLATSFARLTQRAGGEGHEKPWHYYPDLLARDGATLLTILGALVAVGLLARHGRGRWAFFLAVACFGTLAAYCAIPYKTPWLVLGVLPPAALLTGALINRATWRALHEVLPSPAVSPALLMGGPVLLGAALVMGALRSHHLVTNARAEILAPYAYAHTAGGLLKLPRRLDALKLKRDQARIAVVASDPWPLPWYLRRWPNTGFWQPGQDPGKADVYITESDVDPALTRRLSGRRPEFFRQREHVTLVLWPSRHSRLPEPE